MRHFVKCKLLVLSPLFSTATLFDALAGTFEFPILLFSVYGIGFGRLANMLEELHKVEIEKLLKIKADFLSFPLYEVDRFGRGSVMVWAGISIDNRIDLIRVPGRLNAMNYIENILEDHVVPAAYGVRQNFILMQGNTAGITRNFLQERGIQVMEWPALSPDLNPMEHVWDQLDRGVRKRRNPPLTIQELTQALIEEWESIPQESLRRLVRSMPRRAKGYLSSRVSWPSLVTVPFTGDMAVCALMPDHS
ncbi:hypothetical protein GEV33_004331 [Tenebrio molitor]|uniref:Tc1-like transposase DDE domain-containing protein n=1 Tax=Tenebrio molitor TaxID=7067 RepID=A0A8J6HPM4_TENMO|nr:hypothetical protein GEV33_004331 [Tenebrio molitor]